MSGVRGGAGPMFDVWCLFRGGSVGFMSQCTMGNGHMGPLPPNCGQND